MEEKDNDSQKKRELFRDDSSWGPPYLDKDGNEVIPDGNVMCRREWEMLYAKATQRALAIGLTTKFSKSVEGSPKYVAWEDAIRKWLNMEEKEFEKEFKVRYLYRFFYIIPVQENYVGAHKNDNLENARNIFYAFLFDEPSYTRDKYSENNKEVWAQWYPASIIAMQINASGDAKPNIEDKVQNFESTQKDTTEQFDELTESGSGSFDSKRSSSRTNFWNRHLRIAHVFLILGAVVVTGFMGFWISKIYNQPSSTEEIVINLASTYPRDSEIFNKFFARFAKKFEKALSDETHRKLRIQLVADPDFGGTDDARPSPQGLLASKNIQLLHCSPYHFADEDRAVYLFSGLPFGRKGNSINNFIDSFPDFYRDSLFSRAEKKWLAFATGNTGPQTGGWFRKKYLNREADGSFSIIRDLIKDKNVRFGGWAGKIFDAVYGTRYKSDFDLAFMLDHNTAAAEWVGIKDDSNLGWDKLDPNEWFLCQNEWNEPGCVPSLLVDPIFFMDKFGLSKESLERIIKEQIHLAFSDESKDGCDMNKYFLSFNVPKSTSKWTVFELADSDLNALKSEAQREYREWLSKPNTNQVRNKKFWDKYIEDALDLK